LPGLLYRIAISVAQRTIASGSVLAHLHSRAAQELGGRALVLHRMKNRPPVCGYDKPYEKDRDAGRRIAFGRCS